MTVPNLIPAEGIVVNVRPSAAISPYLPNWWMTNLIDRIPETSVGWMVAQGWSVVRTYVEETNGQTFYVMGRQSMQNWMILQALLNSYTQAYNEGRAANVIRYENIIELWNEVIHKSREQLDVQGNVSDDHITIYVNQFDDLVAGVASEMDLALGEATDAGTIVAAQLAEYLVKLGTLEGIYDTHETDAEALLVNLGVTETARINEHFANLLNSLRQGMVNRGLYSSGLYAQTETRVAREKTEALALHNERLAREKLENEHKLFTQELAVKGNVLDGKMKNATMQHQQGQFLVEVRTKCALAVMEARLKRIQGRMEIRDREEKLMAYQLDLRNNLVVGLFGFMERRQDTYPSMEAITKLVAGLGDAGGGWVQT